MDKMCDLNSLIWLIWFGLPRGVFWGSFFGRRGFSCWFAGQSLLWPPFAVMLVVGLASNAFTHESLSLLICITGVSQADNATSQNGVVP